MGTGVCPGMSGGTSALQAYSPHLELVGLSAAPARSELHHHDRNKLDGDAGHTLEGS